MRRPDSEHAPTSARAEQSISLGGGVRPRSKFIMLIMFAVSLRCFFSAAATADDENSSAAGWSRSRARYTCAYLAYLSECERRKFPRRKNPSRMARGRMSAAADDKADHQRDDVAINSSRYANALTRRCLRRATSIFSIAAEDARFLSICARACRN